MGEIIKKKWLVALMLVSIISVFAGGMISPIEVRFLNQITNNSSLSSFAFTIGTIASTLGVLVISYLANIYGRKKMLFISLLFSLIIPVLYANAYATLQLYGVKFAWAFSAAGIGTIIAVFIQKEVSILKSSQGTLFGFLYSIQAGAGSVGAVFGGYVAGKFGMISVFYVVGILYLIKVLLISAFYTSVEETDVIEKKKEGNFIEGIKFIWSNPDLRSRFILVTAFDISWSTKSILYPLIIFAATSSEMLTGTILGTQGFVAMLVLPIVGRAVDKLGYSKVLWFGYFVLGAAILILSLSSYLWIIWFAVGLVALGEACNGPAMSTLEVKAIPEYLRNSVVAVHSVYSTIIQTFATFVVGLLLITFKPQNVLFIISITIFVALSSVYLYSRRYAQFNG